MATHLLFQQSHILFQQSKAVLWHTSLTLDRRPLFEKLWRNDLNLLSFANPPKTWWQIFSDLLTALSVNSTHYLLESRFEGSLEMKLASRICVRLSRVLTRQCLKLPRLIGLPRALLMDLLKPEDLRLKSSQAPIQVKSTKTPSWTAPALV